MQVSVKDKLMLPLPLHLSRRRRLALNAVSPRATLLIRGSTIRGAPTIVLKVVGVLVVAEVSVFLPPSMV